MSTVRFSIDLKAIDLRAVRAHVERFKAAEAKGGVVVVADRHAPMGVVVSVTDQIRLAAYGHHVQIMVQVGTKP